MERAIPHPNRLSFVPDKVGILIAAVLFYALAALPFVAFKANRIVQGEARHFLDALPPGWGYGLISTIGVAGLAALFCRDAMWRLAIALASLLVLAMMIGSAATFLTPEENAYVRVSAASGFWLLLSGLILMITDAIARLDPKPGVRLAMLCGAFILFGAILLSGHWNDLSLLKEYASRADIFWTEATRHVQLALGSLFAATLIGIPLGLLCYKITMLRAGVLNTLNIVQTIPSIALFGLLIAPLGWIAANIPGASEIGIRGIGMAPAFVALFFYSLLPVVSNTVVGLDGVSHSVREAARGLGMTGAQRLLKIDLPLAMPIILTGIRIVLVQNIGLATIAALIGGGGLGVFVFQGIGQTAMDLVLLGTIPTVIMGFTAAILLDALIESKLFRRGGKA